MEVSGGSSISTRWSDMKGLAVHVIAGRWFVMFASFLIMASSGTSYMFGLYSSDVKVALGYDQTTLNLVSFFKDIGASVGILAGFINEFFPPWVVLAVGAVLNFFGYFMVWLAVTQRIAKPQLWKMCLYIYIGANSQTFSNIGAMITCVKNFPESRGVNLGIQKGYVGLSGAIITQLFHASYYSDTKQFILLIAWLPSIISLVFLRTIRYMTPVRHPNELKVFYKFLYISLGLASFLILMILLQRKFHFSQSAYAASATVVLSLLLLPIVVVCIEEYKTWHVKQLALKEHVNNILVTDNNNKNLLRDDYRDTLTKKEVKWWENIFSPPERGEDYTILQALFSIDMIILLMATICSLGGTLTAIDNLGQIGSSLKYPKSSISTFVSLVSIWNYLGRVFSGFVSEYYLVKYKFPRPLMLTLICVFSCVGHLLIAFDVKNGLYVASVIIGFTLGAQWPLIFAIISELFGLKYYSTLCSFGGVASPIGLYMLNTWITGHLYDKEAKKQLATLGLQRKEGQELNCDGINCFKMSFIIITASTMFGAFVSLILVIRTRKFYKSDIYKKFREVATSAGMVTETEMVVGPSENKTNKAEKEPTVGSK